MIVDGSLTWILFPHYKQNITMYFYRAMWPQPSIKKNVLWYCLFIYSIYLLVLSLWHLLCAKKCPQKQVDGNISSLSFCPVVCLSLSFSLSLSDDISPSPNCFGPQLSENDWRTADVVLSQALSLLPLSFSVLFSSEAVSNIVDHRLSSCLSLSPFCTLPVKW